MIDNGKVFVVMGKLVKVWDYCFNLFPGLRPRVELMLYYFFVPTISQTAGRCLCQTCANSMYQNNVLRIQSRSR